MKTLSISDVRQAGYDRGYSIASWQDLPAIGEVVKPFTCSAFVGTIEDVSDAEEVFKSNCYDAESFNRDFSPFEFTAHDLNEAENSEEAWEAFDEGISEGIDANWAERCDYYDED